MLKQDIEEQLADRLVERIEKTNEYILEKIGESIKYMSTLTPSQAYKIGQVLKYGGSYESIAKELAKASGKNVEEIYKIFEEVAKSNKQFAKQFYEYRGINYIPYNKDSALQKQVKSIATITANAYKNISKTKGIGFVFEDAKGNRYFRDIKETYEEIIDRGILSISQGKETFQSEMRRIMKQMGNSGIVQYESGNIRRLDSAVRMNLLDGIRQLNIENSKRFGKEYNADGVEISVHSHPAPDHADIQGRQFSKKEYEKLENEEIATDVNDNRYNGADKRHIGEYNCYHKIFSIVLGVSKPEYTDEQLEQINKNNTKGFEYNGKHYTMYQGTQLQRRIELEIRKNKDKQILARSSGDNELAETSELKIRQLANKYNELCRVSGLQPKKQRISVPSYRRIVV